MSNGPSEELPEKAPAITRSFKKVEEIQRATGRRTNHLLREILAEDTDSSKSASERWNMLLGKYAEYLEEIESDEHDEYEQVEGDDEAEQAVVDTHNARSEELMHALSVELFRAFKDIVDEKPDKISPLLKEWRALGTNGSLPYLNWENADHVDVIYDCRDLLFDELGFDRAHEDLVLTAIVEYLPELNNILENESIRRADRKQAS